mmetsp:Transcript_7490/g.15514  ORF Transcript_7490/g.15514 Transcript_7490/m.15514 type:complete len:210 (-) Transcript_7490:169-798(-)
MPRAHRQCAGIRRRVRAPQRPLGSPRRRRRPLAARRGTVAAADPPRPLRHYALVSDKNQTRNPGPPRPPEANRTSPPPARGGGRTTVGDLPGGPSTVPPSPPHPSPRSPGPWPTSFPPGVFVCAPAGISRRRLRRRWHRRWHCPPGTPRPHHLRRLLYPLPPLIDRRSRLPMCCTFQGRFSGRRIPRVYGTPAPSSLVGGGHSAPLPQT